MATQLKRIDSLIDLAHHLGAKDPTAESIAHRVYKDTSCGACFTASLSGVAVAGYVEGCDAECPTHELVFPFTPEAFDEALTLCDAEADELWNATHGCDDCALDGAINPECPSCGGDGAIL